MDNFSLNICSKQFIHIQKSVFHVCFYFLPHQLELQYSVLVLQIYLIMIRKILLIFHNNQSSYNIGLVVHTHVLILY